MNVLTMIKAIIIDDEQHCIDRLRYLLQEHAMNVTVTGCFQSAEQGWQGIQQLQPDLVFLDVQLGDKTGFELLGRLTQVPFDIIFTTAFDKYAVQAFKFSALDYLLKPIETDELKQAIQKLSDKLDKTNIAAKMQVLLENLKNNQDKPKRICVPVVSGLIFLNISDIIRCQSSSNYTTLYLTGQQAPLLVAKTLKEFEDMLTEYDFFRIHHSHLINLAYVKSYHKRDGGYITLTDNTEVEVATRRREDLLKKLSAHSL